MNDFDLTKYHQQQTGQNRGDGIQQNILGIDFDYTSSDPSVSDRGTTYRQVSIKAAVSLDLNDDQIVDVTASYDLQPIDIFIPHDHDGNNDGKADSLEDIITGGFLSDQMLYNQLVAELVATPPPEFVMYREESIDNQSIVASPDLVGNDGPVSPEEPVYAIYIIKRGETVSLIANRYGLNQDDVVRMNPSLSNDINRIYLADTEIFLPLSPEQAAARSIPIKTIPEVVDVTTPTILSPEEQASHQLLLERAKEANARTHVVAPIHVIEPNQALEKIAAMYGVGVRQILEINEFRLLVKLQAGQEILIPEPPISFTVSEDAPYGIRKASEAMENNMFELMKDLDLDAETLTNIMKVAMGIFKLESDYACLPSVTWNDDWSVSTSGMHNLFEIALENIDFLILSNWNRSEGPYQIMTHFHFPLGDLLAEKYNIYTGTIMNSDTATIAAIIVLARELKSQILDRSSMLDPEVLENMFYYLPYTYHGTIPEDRIHFMNATYKGEPIPEFQYNIADEGEEPIMVTHAAGAPFHHDSERDQKAAYAFAKKVATDLGYTAEGITRFADVAMYVWHVAEAAEETEDTFIDIETTYSGLTKQY